MRRQCFAGLSVPDIGQRGICQRRTTTLGCSNVQNDRLRLEPVCAQGLIRVTDPAKALSLSQNHKQAGVVGLPLMHLASLNPHGGPLKTSVITTIATDVVSVLSSYGDRLTTN